MLSLENPDFIIATSDSNDYGDFLDRKNSQSFSPSNRQQLTRSGSYYKDFDIVKKRKKFRAECNLIKARLDKNLKEQERLAFEAAEKQRKELELQKFRELEALRKEKELKTKHFFEFNSFHRKIKLDDDPYYYGDLQFQSSGWRPHGQGQFVVNKRTLLEGNFVKGAFIEGKVMFFKHGYKWEGQLHNNLIHGIGYVTKLRPEEMEAQEVQEDDEDEEERKEKQKREDRKLKMAKRYQTIMGGKEKKENDDNDDDNDEERARNQRKIDEEEVKKQYLSREAIAYHGDIVCYKDGLVEGLQIEFCENILNNYKTIDGIFPRVTLIYHIKDWKYFCRFHDESHPRERIVSILSLLLLCLSHMDFLSVCLSVCPLCRLI
jgi:hypothetical protein